MDERVAKFLGVAKAWAGFSKDPASQVGCLITDKRGVTLSTGFNGHVSGYSEEFLSWTRPAKYGTVLHAEKNAVIFAECSLRDSVAYVTHAPCNHCLAMLLQAGVVEIHFEQDGHLERMDPLDLDALYRLVCEADRHGVLMMQHKEDEPSREYKSVLERMGHGRSMCSTRTT